MAAGSAEVFCPYCGLDDETGHAPRCRNHPRDPTVSVLGFVSWTRGM